MHLTRSVDPKTGYRHTIRHTLKALAEADAEYRRLCGHVQVEVMEWDGGVWEMVEWAGEQSEMTHE